MSYSRARASYALAALLGASFLLAACDGPQSSAGKAFPMSELPGAKQPPPAQPLLPGAVVTTAEVLPAPKKTNDTPLPAGVPLPTAKAAPMDGSDAAPAPEDTAVNPAAGQAAAITDGKSGQEPLGAPK